MHISLRPSLAERVFLNVKPGFFQSTGMLWFWWFSVILFIFLVQMLTIDVLPHLQQDEVQITDYGRLALDPTSGWAVTWLIEEDKPLLLWSYLGPLIAELSFQIGGISGLGPRIASLAGGIFAASMAFGWLTSRRVATYAAFGLGIAFLLDPLFVLSQRMGRVDAWVIGCCLASCWLLQLAKNRKGYSYIAIAGGLAAAAAFIWPSAIFLYPLIIMEFVGLLSERASTARSRVWLRVGIFFGLGGIVTSLFLLLPIRKSLELIFNDMGSMVAHNIDASRSTQDQLFALFNHQHWLKLAKVYIKTLSFHFPVLALVVILLRKEKAPILALLASMAIIFASLVYEFRALYLLPYFVLIISGLNRDASAPSQRSKKLFRKYSLVILVLWSIGISLILRTIMGFENKSDLDRNDIYAFANSSIGQGEYNVFLNYTYELYFAGRSLGWKIYTPYIQYANDSNGNWIRNTAYEEDPAFKELLSQMDFALFAEGSINEVLEQQLAAAGLHLVHTPGSRGGQIPTVAEEISRNQEMILWFLRGKETYGSYVLYKR